MSDRQPIHIGKKKDQTTTNTDDKPSPHLGSRSLRRGHNQANEMLFAAVKNSARQNRTTLSALASEAQVAFGRPQQANPPTEAPLSVQPVPAAAVSRQAQPRTDSAESMRDDKEKEAVDAQRDSGVRSPPEGGSRSSSAPVDSAHESAAKIEVLQHVARLQDLVSTVDASRNGIPQLLELVKANVNQAVWLLEKEQQDAPPTKRSVPPMLGEISRRGSSKQMLDINKQLQSVELVHASVAAPAKEEAPAAERAPFIKSLSKQDLNQHAVTKDYDSPKLGARSIKGSPLVASRRRHEAPAASSAPAVSSRANVQKRIDPKPATRIEDEQAEEKLAKADEIIAEPPGLRPAQHALDADSDDGSDDEGSQTVETVTVHERTPTMSQRASQSDLLPLRRADAEALSSGNLGQEPNIMTRGGSLDGARLSKVFSAVSSLLQNEKPTTSDSQVGESLDRSALPKISTVGSGVTEDYNSPDINSRRLRSRQLNASRTAVAEKEARGPTPSSRAGGTSSRAVTSHSVAIPTPEDPTPAPQDVDPVLLSVKQSPFLSMDRLRDRLLREGDLSFKATSASANIGENANSDANTRFGALAVAVRRPSDKGDASPPGSPKEHSKAMLLRQFAKEDLEQQDMQALREREETPRPEFVRRLVDADDEVDATKNDNPSVTERRQILEALAKIHKLTASSHFSSTALGHVKVLLQLAVNQIESNSQS
jgi:hypothetical protein